MQAYSDKRRETDPNALPDVETFFVSIREASRNAAELSVSDEHDGMILDEPGWYWQHCFPGCLPDGDPIGPFETEAEALADAQSEND